MNRARTIPSKRLVFEELESRSMLAAVGMGMLAGGGFPDDAAALEVPGLFGSAISATLSTTVAGSGATGAMGMIPGSAGAVAFNAGTVGVFGGNGNIGSQATAAAAAANGLLAFDATSGNGQITLTTGANTPGISSFAMPTNGISDKIGAGS